MILFSQTAQVSSVADVASQSLLARTQILTFRRTRNAKHRRRRRRIRRRRPRPTARRCRSHGHRQHRRLGLQAQRRPHADAGADVKPSRGVIVAPVTAPPVSVAPADLTNATQRTLFAMNGHFNAQMTAVTAQRRHVDRHDLRRQSQQYRRDAARCRRPPRNTARRVTFKLTVYTCFGAVSIREVGKDRRSRAPSMPPSRPTPSAHPDNS